MSANTSYSSSIGIPLDSLISTMKGKAMSLAANVYPKSKLRRYTLWTYDIWGNARYGWEVNDRYKCGTITIRCKLTIHNSGTSQEFACYHPTDYQLSRAVRPSSSVRLEWEGESDYTLYATNRRNGKPVCELEYMGDE